MPAYSDLQDRVDYARGLVEQKFGSDGRLILGNGWRIEQGATIVVTFGTLQQLIVWLEQAGSLGRAGA